jgi:hypothetical protein
VFVVEEHFRQWTMSTSILKRWIGLTCTSDIYSQCWTEVLRTVVIKSLSSGMLRSGTGPSRLGGRVLDETVKYGHGFCVTRTIEWLHCKLQTRPLWHPHRNKTATFWQEVISGHKSQSELDTLTYWLMVRHKVTLTLMLRSAVRSKSVNVVRGICRLHLLGRF